MEGINVSLRQMSVSVFPVFPVVSLWQNNSVSQSVSQTSARAGASREVHNGCQHSRRDSDGVFLPGGPRDRHLGLVQVQKRTEEKCSHCDGHGPAGKQEHQLGGGNLHNDR